MPANIEVAGQPVIGRSGGGLFAADGQLIGVCNLADPKDNEGIYAALTVLQQNLDRAGLSQVYQRSAPQLAEGRTTPRPKADTLAVREPPAMPDRMPRPALDDRRPGRQPSAATSAPLPLTPVAAALADDTEVICIVRSRSNPSARSEVLVVDRPARDLLDRLTRDSQGRGQRDPVVLQASRSDSPLGGSAPSRWSTAERRTGRPRPAAGVRRCHGIWRRDLAVGRICNPSVGLPDGLCIIRPTMIRRTHAS